jgi:putative transposase
MKTRALFVQPRLKGISVRRQCELLQVHRSRLYYKPVGEKPENIKMMQLMDKHLLNHPTEGVVSIVLFLLARGYPVGPKRIRRLLRLMGRETLYRRKNLTRLGLKQFIKPYLPTQPGMVHGHHLHPDEERLHVPDGHHRRVQPKDRRLGPEQLLNRGMV